MVLLFVDLAKIPIHGRDLGINLSRVEPVYEFGSIRQRTIIESKFADSCVLIGVICSYGCSEIQAFARRGIPDNFNDATIQGAGFIACE